MALIDFKLIKKFQQEAQVVGIHSAANNLLTSLGIIPLEVRGDVPSDGPVLIISNHPGGLDSFTLLAAFKRKDFFFVALSTYQIFGEKLSRQLLPIYRKKGLNHLFFEYPLHLTNTPGREKLSLEEVRTRNRATIQNAANCISEGHVVSIFPMGSVGKKQKDSSWKSGVGHLVKQIENAQTNVLFVKIENGGKTEFARFLHPRLRKMFFRNKKKIVHISLPIELSSLVSIRDNAKDITRKLERAYGKQWR